jgi:hypothetical protein
MRHSHFLFIVDEVRSLDIPPIHQHLAGNKPDSPETCYHSTIGFKEDFYVSNSRCKTNYGNMF